jgi:hypothetical protein
LGIKTPEKLLKKIGLLELQPDVLKIPQSLMRFNESILISQTG